MFWVPQRTRLKNRIQGALARYNVQTGTREVFSVEGRLNLGRRLGELPTHTRQSVELELTTVDFLEVQIEEVEKHIEEIMQVPVEADLLKTLPCVKRILSMVMTLEIGRGAIPLVCSSGQLRRLGAAGALQRRAHTPGTNLRRREPVFEVGIYRGWKLGGGASATKSQDSSAQFPGHSPPRPSLSESWAGGRSL